jgi:hypothetical protein
MPNASKAAAVAAGLALTLAAACAEVDAPFDARAGEVLHTRMPDRTVEINRQLAELRRVTAPFHNIDAAARAGYDVQITPCWAHTKLGAQGYHYGNPDLISDGGAIELLRPELLMYEPGPGGQLRLVGLEYIVPIDEWTGEQPPSLLGETFHPHSFLPIYKLHVWLWRDNPSGIFADWNPKVSCEHAAEVEVFE